MRPILLSTDFSTRSDRALRRAILLAGKHRTELVVIHVVDDDQAPELVRAAERESTMLLERLAATVRDVDGIACRAEVRLGEPFEQIAQAADAFDAAYVVMGPHRRQALHDIFAGTTIERTMREARRPILMANGVPAGPYRHILLATDLSDHSRRAISEAKACGLLDGARATIFNAYSDPFRSLIGRADLTEDQLEAHLAELAAKANADLRKFVGEHGFGHMTRLSDFAEISPADAIARRVKSERVDLVVTGTHGANAIERILLGSVAEEVLRNATVDVFVVPRARP